MTQPQFVVLDVPSEVLAKVSFEAGHPDASTMVNVDLPGFASTVEVASVPGEAYETGLNRIPGEALLLATVAQEDAAEAAGLQLHGIVDNIVLAARLRGAMGAGFTIGGGLVFGSGLSLGIEAGSTAGEKVLGVASFLFGIVYGARNPKADTNRGAINSVLTDHKKSAQRASLLALVSQGHMKAQATERAAGPQRNNQT